MFLKSVISKLPVIRQVLIRELSTPPVDLEKDRSQPVSVETSIRYLESAAYKVTYGDDVVWKNYRRNQTRHYLKDTRKSCIRKQSIATGSPCPICRDKYLVVHYLNVKLLKQFISPDNGGVLPTIKTGICQVQHKNLLAAIIKAKDYGLISYQPPFRFYDYEFYMSLDKAHSQEKAESN